MSHLRLVDRHYLADYRAPKRRSPRQRARQLIKSYTDGDDMDPASMHLLLDAASENGQILDNIVKTAVFLKILTENIEALDGTGGEHD